MEYNVKDDQIPLVTYARTNDTVWQVYVGGSIAVRETNSGNIEIKTADQTNWTRVATKEVYA